VTGGVDAPAVGGGVLSRVLPAAGGSDIAPAFGDVAGDLGVSTCAHLHLREDLVEQLLGCLCMVSEPDPADVVAHRGAAARVAPLPYWAFACRAGDVERVDRVTDLDLRRRVVQAERQEHIPDRVLVAVVACTAARMLVVFVQEGDSPAGVLTP